MILQYSDAAISTENKIHANPASIDNTPVSADQEDHVSMGFAASKKAYQIVKNVAKMISIEIYSACQALEFTKDKKPSPALKKVYDFVRSLVPPLKEDRRYDDEVYWVIEQLEKGLLVKLVKDQVDIILGDNLCK